MFSNEHINYLITYTFNFRNEELLSYYISFLRFVVLISLYPSYSNYSFLPLFFICLIMLREKEFLNLIDLKILGNTHIYT